LVAERERRAVPAIWHEAAVERKPNAFAPWLRNTTNSKEHTLATTGATGSTRVDRPQPNGIRSRIAERNHETKAAIKTTEFWAMLGLVVAILVSAALIKGGDNGTDEFIAKQAWLYVSILGGAYFISRGLAKSGSYEPDSDYNPIDLAERKRDGGTDR
jgi:hypothetical protein